MLVIGITGGIGAGKSKVLNYIQQKYYCRIILADEVGNEVKKPGEECYKKLVTLLGNDILNEDNTINKIKMADIIFADEVLLKSVNNIIHPAVTTYILNQIEKEKKEDKIDFFFIEAALLIECGYALYVDELWYIHANSDIRKKRLRESRNYSEEKIERIMSGQLSDEMFKSHCNITIDNSSDFENTKLQIDKKLGEELWKMRKNTQDN